MYVGVVPRSRLVRGIEMSHSERDEFRIGISSALHRNIVPAPRPTDVNVRFIPVARHADCDDAAKRRFIPDRYVIGEGARFFFRCVNSEALLMVMRSAGVCPVANMARCSLCCLLCSEITVQGDRSLSTIYMVQGVPYLRRGASYIEATPQVLLLSCRTCVVVYLYFDIFICAFDRIKFSCHAN